MLNGPDPSAFSIRNSAFHVVSSTQHFDNSSRDPESGIRGSEEQKLEAGSWKLGAEPTASHPAIFEARPAARQQEQL
jgi:hypothetical protein